MRGTVLVQAGNPNVASAVLGRTPEVGVVALIVERAIVVPVAAREPTVNDTADEGTIPNLHPQSVEHGKVSFETVGVRIQSAHSRMPWRCEIPA